MIHLKVEKLRVPKEIAERRVCDDENRGNDIRDRTMTNDAIFFSKTKKNHLYHNRLGYLNYKGMIKSEKRVEGIEELIDLGERPKRIYPIFCPHVRVVRR